MEWLFLSKGSFRLEAENGVHLPRAGEALGGRVGVGFHQGFVVVHLQVGDSVKAHGGDGVWCCLGPVGNAREVGVAGGGKLYPGPSHLVLQPLGHLGDVLGLDILGVVEHIGFLRVVPGHGAVVEGGLQVEHPVPGVAAGLGPLLAQVQEPAAQAGVQEQHVRQVPLGIGLSEQPDHLLLFVTEELCEVLVQGGFVPLVLDGVADLPVEVAGEFPQHRAHQHGNVQALLPPAEVQGVAQKVLPIGQGSPAHALALLVQGVNGVHGGLGQVVPVHVLDPGCLCFRDAQVLQDQGRGLLVGGTVLFYSFRAAVATGPARFHNGPVEQAVRRRGLGQGDHLAAAAGLAKDGDVLRVAAKVLNVLMDPLQCGHQVGQARLGGVLVLLPILGQV